MSVVLTMTVIAAGAAAVWGSSRGEKSGEEQNYVEETQGSYDLGQDHSMAGVAALGEGSVEEPEAAEANAAPTDSQGETTEALESGNEKESTLQAGDESGGKAEEANAEPRVAESPEEQEGQEGEEPENKEAASNLVNPEAELNFTYFNETSMLQWPVEGNIIMDFSMDSTIYHPTLDVYKTNPAILIQAEPGTPVAAPAAGVVATVDHNEELGDFIVIDMGNGYQVKCGQMTQIPVASGQVVEAGTYLGQVADPTKYYVVEGSNLYFGMTKDGTPIDPVDYLQ